MFSLKDRRALVTGGGRGIGRAIALALARAGGGGGGAARAGAGAGGGGGGGPAGGGGGPGGRAAPARAGGGGGGVGGRALAISADLARPEAAREVLEAMTAGLGPVDVLVNNAGIGSSADPRPVADFDDAFWELSLALNLTAPYRLSKAVLPHMRSRRWGRIINVASINGKVPSLHGAAYTASKHGLLGLTKTLALEVAKEGITVNAICPGPVHTVMNDRRLEYDAQRRGVTFAEIEQGLTPIGGRLE